MSITQSYFVWVCHSDHRKKVRAKNKGNYKSLLSQQTNCHGIFHLRQFLCLAYPFSSFWSWREVVTVPDLHTSKWCLSIGILELLNQKTTRYCKRILGEPEEGGNVLNCASMCYRIVYPETKAVYREIAQFWVYHDRWIRRAKKHLYGASLNLR